MGPFVLKFSKRNTSTPSTYNLLFFFLSFQLLFVSQNFCHFENQNINNVIFRYFFFLLQLRLFFVFSILLQKPKT